MGDSCSHLQESRWTAAQKAHKELMLPDDSRCLSESTLSLQDLNAHPKNTDRFICADAFIRKNEGMLFWNFFKKKLFLTVATKIFVLCLSSQSYTTDREYLKWSSLESFHLFISSPSLQQPSLFPSISLPIGLVPASLGLSCGIFRTSTQRQSSRAPKTSEWPGIKPPVSRPSPNSGSVSFSAAPSSTKKH